jgi:thiol:disulfide interchange protein DsbC
MNINKFFFALILLTLNTFANEKDIVNNLGQYIPNLKESDIAESSFKGIYEIILTDPRLDIIYSSSDGLFIIQGDIIDLENGSNITKRRRADLAKKALTKSQDKNKIIYRAEDEKYTINIFTDVDCPYCRKLHKDISKLNELGITVKYLAFPRSGVNTESYFKSVSIWCSKDKKLVMDQAMLQIDPPSINCESPVIEHLNLAQDIGVSGTPYIFFENGINIPGYVKPKVLLKEMQRSLESFK